jgi:hypothetical protein
MRLLIMAGALTLIAGPAWAQDKERDYCPARPGLGTPACTIAPGRVSVETALADWTLDKQGGDRSDTVLLGDTSVRIGLTDAIEAQIGWTPVGIVRDRSGGTVDRATRVGDITLGLKANLLHPDGSGLSIAIQPYATLPAGKAPVGAGDWGAGVVVPVTYDLNETLNLQATTEADAAVDQDGRGRHGAFSETIGLGIKASEAVSVTLEGQVARDEDPSGHTTQFLSAVSLAWTPKDDLQFDLGAIAGLNRDAPDLELVAGISRRF